MPRPLILSPAGSAQAQQAAAEAGADEIYFGLSSYNARINAKNFTDEEVGAALKECKLRGIKTNITLNTLVTDREMKDVCGKAYDALCKGADAFIVQDLGLASTLKKAIPEITLHASTQCACHSKSGAEMLAEIGFERIVLARELDSESIRNIVALGLETEVFVHGALCVCHSGMCLMSSVIGKRSGNRGLCAQPCRLPYKVESIKTDNEYPLSLKDLSLAKHITELCSLGVTSLKIEGRMKPPEYVYGVTKIWKKLVIEGGNANDKECEQLEALFSRSGFTDKYFTGKFVQDNKNMYGVRTKEDKDKSKLARKDTVICEPVKRKISVFGTFAEGEKPVVTMTCGDINVTVQADFEMQTAQNRPLDKAEIGASFAKLGDTHFVCNNVKVEVLGSVFAPKSSINALRRSAVSALENAILDSIKKPEFHENAFTLTPKEKKDVDYPLCRLFPQRKESAEKMLQSDYGYKTDSVCLPLYMFKEDIPPAVAEAKKRNIPFGVRMPRVVFDNEAESAIKMLENAKESGVTYAVAENIGHIPLIRKVGLDVFGGAGLNVYNSYSVKVLEELGLKSVTLSPELLTAQMRDIVRCGDIELSAVVGGRLEIMVLESCIVRANGKCTASMPGEICAQIKDRINTLFPIRAERRLGKDEFPCRNVILNSVPLRLIDKPEELRKTGVGIYCIYED